MTTAQTIKLEQVKQRIDAKDSDMSGSSFTDVSLIGARFNDVNLAGATINDANMSDWRVQNVNLTRLQINCNADLTGASIAESVTDGMTIDGIPVADLLAAYRTAHPQSDSMPNCN